MESKIIQKTAISLVLLSFLVLCILRENLLPYASQAANGQHSSLATATEKRPVTLMTEDNNPTLFADTFCDFQGNVEWYPAASNNTTDDVWQLRTPYFIVGGAKKCATTSLFRYLTQHERIQPARRKELLFFLPKNFHHIDETTGKVLVKDARETMYTRDYNGSILQQNPSLYAFEATPGYIFQSTRSPKLLLCAAPWVKLVFILREPVDRVWSNYNFYLTHGIKLSSFDAWVQRDLSLLQRMGMLPDNRHSDDFVGSDEEYYAWDLYLKRCNEGPVGRSMYVVQLLHWYQAFRAIGRDPSSQILVVRNEDLKQNPQATMDRITSFLGIDSQTLVPERTKEFMVSKYEVGVMSNETHEMLQEFYRPYNERLYDLLGRDEWQGAWENSTSTTRSAASSSNTSSKVYVQDRTATRKRKRNKKNRQRNKQQKLNGLWYDESQSAVSVDVKEDTYVYGKPSYNATAAADFVKQWCDVDGIDWYPTGNDDAWQLRAPYLLIPGAKKSGTTSLAFYLMQHDKVAKARTKELQFFMNKNFRARYVRDDDRKTLVKDARSAYELEFKKSQLQSDPSLISMDATPGYLFFSSMLPQRILCVSPWVKLLIILRNPIDRTYSNYQYLVWRSKGRYQQSFEKAIQTDIVALTKAGVLVDDDKTYSIGQEDEAWNTYLGLASEGIVGRSLYVIQLRQWFQAIRDVGRDPDSQVHLVRTEDIKEDLDGEYRKVQEFLGLEYEPIKSPEPKVVNTYEPMKNETRGMLEKVFAPYNQRLYDMLGGDWEGYWDS